MSIPIIGRFVWTGDNIVEAFEFLGVKGRDVEHARGVGIVMDKLVIDRFYGVGLSLNPEDELVLFKNGALVVNVKKEIDRTVKKIQSSQGRFVATENGWGAIFEEEEQCLKS